MLSNTGSTGSEENGNINNNDGNDGGGVMDPMLMVQHGVGHGQAQVAEEVIVVGDDIDNDQDSSSNHNNNDSDNPEQSSGSEGSHHSSDDDDDSVEAIPIPRVLGPLDEGRMALGATERQWALELKEAAKKCPELEPLSDFMYAQIAIVSFHEHHQNLVATRAALPTIIERMQGLQGLREEYLIREELQQGFQIMRKVVFDVLPGWFLAFSYHSDRGAYLRVISLVNFDMSIFTHKDKARQWLQAVYYMNHAHIPDMEAARQGFVQFIECKGYDWRNQNMFHMKAFSEAAPSFALYPILCQMTIHYNTGMFVRLMWAMAKRLLPKHMTKDFQFESGCITNDVTRLEEVFVVPTPEIARERLVARLQDALRRRYENEANFRL